MGCGRALCRSTRVRCLYVIFIALISGQDGPSRPGDRSSLDLRVDRGRSSWDRAVLFTARPRRERPVRGREYGTHSLLTETSDVWIHKVCPAVILQSC